MTGNFGKTFTNQPMNDCEKLSRRAASARMNIILIIILTVVNAALIFFDVDTYFLFSASVPYFLIFFTALYSGSMPDSAYDGVAVDEIVFLPQAFLGFAIAVAAVILGLYAVCFFASQSKLKNADGIVTVRFNAAWLITATALFAVDTLAYLGLVFFTVGFSFSTILDLAIHAYVIVTFIMGAVAAVKLKNLPAAAPAEPVDLTDAGDSTPPAAPSDSEQ